MSELSAWIHEHKCTYDIQPVVELSEGGPSQSGFELHLHAELVVPETLGPAAGKALDEIRDKLGEILESLIPKDTKAHVERVPFRRSVRFPKGASGNPLVTRTARVFLPDYSAMQPGDREKLRPTEERLQDLGFTRA
jgi:hypothetical protein